MATLAVGRKTTTKMTMYTTTTMTVIEETKDNSGSDYTDHRDGNNGDEDDEMSCNSNQPISDRACIVLADGHQQLATQRRKK